MIFKAAVTVQDIVLCGLLQHSNKVYQQVKEMIAKTYMSSLLSVQIASDFDVVNMCGMGGWGCVELRETLPWRW